MMQPTWTATLLVTFYLLTSAATAYAECAWVLWERVRVGVPEEWQPLDSYEEKKFCDRASIQLIRSMLENDPRRANYLACFPDTIDPRGPKGGGR